GRSEGGGERVAGNGREEQREIRVRKREEPHGALRRGVSLQSDRLPHERGTEADGGDQVDDTHGVEGEQQERDADHDDRVHEDLTRGGGDTPRHREHRDAGRARGGRGAAARGGGAGGGGGGREEGGRAQEEQGGDRHPRGGARRAGGGAPPDETRPRPRRSADHDVLRAPGLEPDRVDED